MTRALGSRVIAALAVAMFITAAVPPEAPVADAAMDGNVERVRELLRSGADVNAAQGDGMTALHWAAEIGSEDLADVLVYAGANIKAVTRIGGFTPLHVASRNGNANVVRTLLAAGADANARTTTGETALHFAAGAGGTEVARALIEHGVDVNAVEGSAGQTALMFAAAYGRAETVEVLLAAGSDLNATTLVVDYPEVGAQDRIEARTRHERLVFLHGDSAKYNQGVDGTSQDDDEEETPDVEEDAALEDAAPTEADEEVATGEPTEFDGDQPKEENKCEPTEAEGAVSDECRRPFSYAELVGKQGGNTALHYAVREGQRDVARALLDGGADVNGLARGDHSSPLLIAALNGHFDLAMELLERGADPNLASAPGATPLYVAVHLQWVPKSFYPQQRAIGQQDVTYLEFMEALLEAGADPNARLERHLWYTSFNHNVLGVDTWGATPFWRAAYGTDVEAMKLLVAYGADPNVATRRPPGRESTGNGEATKKSDEDKSGLPPVEVGGPGVAPIHAASGAGYGLGLAGNAHRHAPNGWLPSVKYLVEELGADVNARDYNGFAPLHNAAARGDVELIDYLVSQGADVTVLTRKGQTTADMANGPVQRVTVFPEVVALLESLGSDNNHNCVSCE